LENKLIKKQETLRFILTETGIGKLRFTPSSLFGDFSLEQGGVTQNIRSVFLHHLHSVLKLLSPIFDTLLVETDLSCAARSPRSPLSIPSAQEPELLVRFMQIANFS